MSLVIGKWKVCCKERFHDSAALEKRDDAQRCGSIAYARRRNPIRLSVPAKSRLGRARVELRASKEVLHEASAHSQAQVWPPGVHARYIVAMSYE
jgi:hypothetical protein